jgi:cytidyltransferase-like protein
MATNAAPIVNDYAELVAMLAARRQDKRVVCTIGSWDILHAGHTEYLRSAKRLGDILVVGVDSDEAYRKYKRKSSWYQETDRQGIVAAVGFVDFVTIVRDVNAKGEWQYDLVKAIQPDVFACNEKAYSETQRAQLGKLCHLHLLAFHEPHARVPSVEANVRLKELAIVGGAR